MQRLDGRAPDQLRPVSFVPNFAPHATGSVLISTGDTRVICSAMVEEVVPRWMKEQNVTGGWVTAEYSMLPYSTLQRKARDISKGKQDGRGVEIQRLVGRSLRAVVDLDLLGPRTLWVDCDVLQADGGTRTAAITGASRGTPGLLTTVRVPSSCANPSVSRKTSTPAPSRPATPSGCPESTARTVSPRPASNRAAACPERASPTTRNGPRGRGGRTSLAGTRRGTPEASRAPRIPLQTAVQPANFLISPASATGWSIGIRV